MKNKSPLMLMEQLLMILVFALAAAFCLQAFVLSEEISAGEERRQQAAQQAQSAVEVLKACHGEYEEAAALFGGSWKDGCWTAHFDEDWNLSTSEGVYMMKAQAVERGLPGLGKALVQILNAEGEVLFTLPAAWQEVSGHG